jgi:hypothetical protein
LIAKRRSVSAQVMNTYRAGLDCERPALRVVA